MKKLILASASPRRREILANLGLEFEIFATDADETTGLPGEPGELVEEIAARKAAACVSSLTEKNGAYPCGSIVIACDTVVYNNGRILTKPKNEADAAGMLGELSGKTHYVYSGLCVTDGEKTRRLHRVTAVKMRDISEAEITAYVQTGEPLDKAGAYGVQERGAVFVEKIDGDYYNVVGLPLSSLCVVLKDEFGYDVTEAFKREKRS